MMHPEAYTADRRVLVISNHATLAKAIEAAVGPVASVTRMDVPETEGLPELVSPSVVEPDLVILTELSVKSEPARARQLATVLEGLERVPLLVICEQPTTMVPAGEAPVHYAAFPFDPQALRDRVEGILYEREDMVSAPKQSASSARVLIVEDERIVAADLKATLEVLGYEVVASLAYAEQAVETVRADPPDLVLMDIHLKGEMDGIQAAALIQAETDVPVIYLTAHADAATLERAQITAPYGYVLKPFEERELHSTIQMTLHRVRAEKKVRDRERWLRAVLQSIGDGVIATDVGGRIAWMNPVAEALTRQPWQAAVGRPLEQIFRVTPVELNGDAVPDTARSHDGGLARLECKGECETIVDHTISPIRDERGKLQGRIVAFRDVTEHVEAQSLLRRRAEELVLQNEELSAFAHTVAHDIKDPLNVVYGYASLLASDWGGLDQSLVREGLQTISEFSRRTANIVDELLLLASVRDAVVLPEPLEMPEIITRAKGRLAHMQQRTKANILCVAETWPEALGYAPWVEEVWVNYLSNAMKYGGSPPVLELGAHRVDSVVHFWVHDNGAGIKPEDQKRLFVPFTRLHQMRATGQGLGLSIVSRIISRLGGTVGVESHPDGGSTFYFTLPACNGTSEDTVEHA